MRISCCCKLGRVAIPSNRVNVSYSFPLARLFCLNEGVSQSPQIGSMFLTLKKGKEEGSKMKIGRNPLKSGQCFLLCICLLKTNWSWSVAIPSNRVNVSYVCAWCKRVIGEKRGSQSPQIGSMFLTEKKHGKKQFASQVAIPSNRVNVSYVIYGHVN